MNKIHRNWPPEREGKEEAWEAYKEQKRKVSRLVEREMGQYERRIAEEIGDRGKRGKLWKNINKLKGKQECRVQSLKVYEGSIELERKMKDHRGALIADIIMNSTH